MTLLLLGKECLLILTFMLGSGQVLHQRIGGGGGSDFKINFVVTDSSFSYVLPFKHIVNRFLRSVSSMKGWALGH